jgi:hypothetical protein
LDGHGSIMERRIRRRHVLLIARFGRRSRLPDAPHDGLNISLNLRRTRWWLGASRCGLYRFGRVQSRQHPAGFLIALVAILAAPLREIRARRLTSRQREHHHRDDAAGGRQSALLPFDHSDHDGDSMAQCWAPSPRRNRGRRCRHFHGGRSYASLQADGKPRS